MSVGSGQSAEWRADDAQLVDEAEARLGDYAKELEPG